MTILISNNSANGIIWRTVIKPQIALIIASIDHEKTDVDITVLTMPPFSVELCQ
jgi:hypothetical protein